MKVSHTYTLLDEGEFSNTDIWSDARDQVLRSVSSIYWPPGNDEFIMRPVKKANGVGPITDQFETNLDRKTNWESTGGTHLKTLLNRRGMVDDIVERMEGYCDDPRDFVSGAWFDGMKDIEIDGSHEFVIAEWETGNISSSHRSLNRITFGLASGIIYGGLIVLPNRELYHYLTGRVGNYPELKPYVMIWESLAHEVENGIIEIVIVEHDGESESVSRIGKMTDGMSDREEPENGGGG